MVLAGAREVGLCSANGPTWLKYVSCPHILQRRNGHWLIVSDLVSDESHGI